jgi:hypothetical protein
MARRESECQISKGSCFLARLRRALLAVRPASLSMISVHRHRSRHSYRGIEGSPMQKRKLTPQEFVTFREWIKEHADESAFRDQYLGDGRKPNHTSIEELREYLRPCPWTDVTRASEKAWRIYSSIPAVKKENTAFWSSCRTKREI